MIHEITLAEPAGDGIEYQVWQEGRDLYIYCNEDLNIEALGGDTASVINKLGLQKS